MEKNRTSAEELKNSGSAVEPKRGSKHDPAQAKNVPSKGYEYDVFICHASEDKEEIARPLAEALSLKKLHVWYDEFTLKLGDSLRGTIDYGLANFRYGVVILSPLRKIGRRKNWMVLWQGRMESKS